MNRNPSSTRISLLVAGLALTGCAAPGVGARCPIEGGIPADHLIEPQESHFRRLWKLTRGGENAEGYWSFAGDRLSLQRTEGERTDDSCDRIFVTEGALADGGVRLRQISNGRGVTTCAHFLPGDRDVVFASTQASMADCPPPMDHSEGYTWKVHPEFDLYVHDLATGRERRLTSEWGYDAEATVSPRGDRMVFTSTRSGDLELWTCNLDGSDLRQVTDTLGYDGGAFFSHDGEQIVFRSTQFTPGKEVQESQAYRALLAEWKVRPQAMEIMLIDADGTNRRQLTELGGASFAPYFFVGDRRVIFSTNHHEESQRNFDLFAIGVDGERLERITTYAGFDSFPMFDATGRYLVFASNRGGDRPGETNLFVAEWRD